MISILQAEDAADCLTLHCGDSGFIWRIDEFNNKFNDAKNDVNPVLYSPPFTAQGYRLALGLCPYGDGRGRYYMGINLIESLHIFSLGNGMTNWMAC